MAIGRVAHMGRIPELREASGQRGANDASIGKIEAIGWCAYLPVAAGRRLSAAFRPPSLASASAACREQRAGPATGVDEASSTATRAADSAQSRRDKWACGCLCGLLVNKGPCRGKRGIWRAVIAASPGLACLPA